jgi:LmbE family N-acetylglucosaminyl deacetylase
MTKNWIYLSPHLDDVALSCGGLVWEQTQVGDQVNIWTICAGDAPAGELSAFAQELHRRWRTGPDAVSQRRVEDIASCAQMSAAYHHLALADCIYRRVPIQAAGGGEEWFYPYASGASIMGPVHPLESALIQQLSAELASALPQEAEVVCPLAWGGHVDHRLTRAAAENMGRELWYYADYPYVMRRPEQVDELRQSGWQAVTHPISPAGLRAWQAAVAAHQSQISTFWPDLAAMQAAVQEYAGLFGGVILWRPGNPK